MSSESTNSKRLDDTGKTIFDAIYTDDSPQPYLTTMRELDYRIPSEALPYFRDLIEQYRMAHPDQHPINILDLGSSYGINGALLKWDLQLSDLYKHYSHTDYVGFSLAQREQHDLQLCYGLEPRGDIKITGLDISAPALAYALGNRLLDHAVHVDLETASENVEQAVLIQQSDCIISTGCLGYVTEVSLRKILELCVPHQPWMAHCILRMFPLEPYQCLFEEYGYRVWQSDVLLPQRKFSSNEEQTQVLDSLYQQGIDTKDFERKGQLWAHVLYVVPEERKIKMR